MCYLNNLQLFILFFGFTTILHSFLTCFCPLTPTDLSPASSLAPMAGLAVEIWTTNAGIFFDNFVVSHTLKDAFNFADATFSLKSQGNDCTFPVFFLEYAFLSSLFSCFLLSNFRSNRLKYKTFGVILF